VILGDNFVGELSQFEMYDNILTDQEIFELAQGSTSSNRRGRTQDFTQSQCIPRKKFRNLLSWTETVLMVDGVRVIARYPSLCLGTCKVL